MHSSKDPIAIVIAGLIVFVIVMISRGTDCTRLARIDQKVASQQGLTGSEHAAYPKLFKKRSKCEK